jgi:glycosyltransferase involved in cell wall biosynthesis
VPVIACSETSKGVFMSKKTNANNILLVANYDSDVGYAWWLMENFWTEISLNFSKAEIGCTLLYPKVAGVPEVIKSSPINIVEHDFSSKKLKSLMNLLKIIRKNRIGFVYLTDKAYYDWLYFFMRMAGVKKIVNHDHTPGVRTRVPVHKKCAKKAINMLRMFSCDHYIGVSNFVRNRAMEAAGISSDKCTCVHNGIKVFDNDRSKYAHKEFQIPRRAKIVVTSGRASFYKGIDTLIRCAYVLINEKGLRNIYFLHVGSGPDLHRFKEMAVGLGVEKKFIFAGYRQDLPKILPSCDIGIQTSQGEAFSLSILEYLCAGLATLAPNSCGNSEAISDGVNGLLFTPGCVTEIAEKIEFMLANKEFTKRIRKEARRSIIENFTIEKCDKELISLLKRQFIS